MYKGKRGSRKRKAPPHRVDNSLPARMRKVGPDHFGLLLVDSGKKHYAARLTNFYGDNLWEPEPVPCRRDALATLIAETKKQMRAHGLVELVVGIERTGRWHQPAKQMLKTVWQVKMIHPFTTKQLRKPASPGIKTDKVDLTAMQRAMVCGYGVDEPELPAVWLELRELSRYRADLGARRASLKVQCKGRMEALIPGYTSVFEDFWKSAAPAALIEAYPSARRMLRAGTDRMRRKLAKAGVTCRRSTAKRARLWAGQAPPADPVGELNAIMLHDSLTRIRQQSVFAECYEMRLMERLVRTPLVLLLTITGVNVVSAAEFGTEMGPHGNYANTRNVTGRAGIFPSRYQSDETDRSGPIVRAGRNARLRRAIMRVAHNLITHNPHFRAWKALPGHRHWGERRAEAAVGNKFVRIAFCMFRQGVRARRSASCWPSAERGNWPTGSSTAWLPRPSTSFPTTLFPSSGKHCLRTAGTGAGTARDRLRPRPAAPPGDPCMSPESSRTSNGASPPVGGSNYRQETERGSHSARLRRRPIE